MVNKIDKSNKLVIAEFHFWRKVTGKLKRDKLINSAGIRPLSKNPNRCSTAPSPKTKKV